MGAAFLHGLPIGAVLTGFMVGQILSFEIGFALGCRARARGGDSSRAEISTIQVGMLGLLSLLLAFSFNVAAGRFESRRQILLEEANAIGTTYLRCGFLDETNRRALRDLVRRYLDVRIDYYVAPANSPELKGATAQSEEVAVQMWSRVAALFRMDPHSVALGSLVQSLNEVVDLNTRQAAVMLMFVPEIVMYLLFLNAMLGMAAVGYGGGLENRRNLFFAYTLAVLIGAVVLVIMDLDRPREGRLMLSTRSLTGLRDSIDHFSALANPPLPPTGKP
jgi:hypothetical protein